MFWESQSSTFWFQLLWGLLDGVQHAVNFFQQVGLLVSAKELKNMAIYIYIYIPIVLEEELKVLDFILWLQYYFVLLGCFPLFMYFFLFSD